MNGYWSRGYPQSWNEKPSTCESISHPASSIPAQFMRVLPYKPYSQPHTFWSRQNFRNHDAQVSLSPLPTQRTKRAAFNLQQTPYNDQHTRGTASCGWTAHPHWFHLRSCTVDRDIEFYITPRKKWCLTAALLWMKNKPFSSSPVAIRLHPQGGAI